MQFISPESTESKKKKDSKTPGEFRLNSQQIFLTYSQCPIEIDTIYSFLSKIVEIDKYIVAQEKHLDGNLHIHAYLLLKKKVNFKNPRVFDYLEYHPKVEGCRSWKKVVQYVTKDGKYITNYEADVLKKIIEESRKVCDIYKRAFEIAKEKGVEEGMKELETSKTYRDLLVHGEAIEKNMKKLRAEDNNVRYTIEQFKPLPFVWNRRKTLVLTGPSDTGKTSLALAMLPQCLFVSDIDDLREYNTGKYKGIVFDDMVFMPDIGTGKGGIDREKQIALFDMDHPRHIKCRYHNAKIPPNTPKIITSNLNIDNICLYSDPAIRKRVQHVEIRDRTFLDENEGTGVQTPVTTSTTASALDVMLPRMGHDEFLRANPFLADL